MGVLLRNCITLFNYLINSFVNKPLTISFVNPKKDIHLEDANDDDDDDLCHCNLCYTTKIIMLFFTRPLILHP
jgi:hypothetical protein